MLLLTCYQLFLTLLHSAIAQQCDSDRCYKVNERFRKEDHALEGLTFKTLPLTGGFDCLGNCFMDCRCQSVNEHGSECHLNSAVNYSTLTYKPGYVYREIEVELTKVNLTRNFVMR